MKTWWYHWRHPTEKPFFAPYPKEIGVLGAVDEYILDLRGAPMEVELQKFLRPKREGRIF
ncbi:hypothetical protein H6F78_02815 [Coleofasciculus sp. FACHB-64]|uniref:hypothetical protein n=1 Tax=Cyanophyceae TaxID=3028117 RepID=UPI00168451A3|nr:MULTISPECIES: hypothetical protein [unclassified Coleofasciculus]MBD1878605.1 hypothetical protein [Coleofasciculus sp. FACHB-T130]MBD1892638.1 hypothetical protein [Coleofasciculus sp. FACHB-SPT9]MBD1900083.1 hypothetical protein [Coleofasciculus sp. FACHB-125]MBD2044571.1 hypothetical protein [Coleofasciculus sp. FACHB-64]MBD2087682.1 hypothetical protein [Coleofasciculus sp. FACHB-542]